MATLPTDAEMARKVLDIFKHFGTRPGEVLLTNNLIAMAAKRDLRTEDLAKGLKYGYAQGWFEDGPNQTIKLTEAGFKAI